MDTIQIDRQPAPREDFNPVTPSPQPPTRMSLPSYMEDTDLDLYRRDRDPRENPTTKQEKPIVVLLPRPRGPNHRVSTDPFYDISSRPKGMMLIINNIKFDGDTKNISYRYGATSDQANMANLFCKLRYRVESYQDLSKQDLETTISQYAQRPELSLVDSLFVTVMSHGVSSNAAGSQVVCRDGLRVDCQWIVDSFNATNCPSLRGKPKIFLFQMCRDVIEGSSPGERAQRDGNFAAFRLNDDVLIANATVQGSSALRDPKKGSWFIQAICKVYAQFAREDDIETLHRKVDNLIKQCAANIEAKSVTQTTTYSNNGFLKFYFYREVAAA